MILAQSSGINSVSLCNWFHNLSRLQRQKVAQHLWRRVTRPCGSPDDLIREIKALKVPSPPWLRAANVQFPRVVICTWPSFPNLSVEPRCLVPQDYWFGLVWFSGESKPSLQRKSHLVTDFFFFLVLWNTCFTDLLTMTFFFATCILHSGLNHYESFHNAITWVLRP